MPTSFPRWCSVMLGISMWFAAMSQPGLRHVDVRPPPLPRAIHAAARLRTRYRIRRRIVRRGRCRSAPSASGWRAGSQRIGDQEPSIAAPANQYRPPIQAAAGKIQRAFAPERPGIAATPGDQCGAGADRHLSTPAEKYGTPPQRQNSARPVPTSSARMKQGANRREQLVTAYLSAGHAPWPTSRYRNEGPEQATIAVHQRRSAGESFWRTFRKL